MNGFGHSSKTLILVILLSAFAVLTTSCIVKDIGMNSLKTGKSAPSARVIPINPPVELDNKSKEEIYAIRKSCVARHRNLLGSDYSPCEAIFGHIESGKPWMGLDGLFCRGRGPNIIDGESEESRFILNPFILLAVEELRIINKAGNCAPSYPMPVSLEWFAAEHKAKVTYDLSGFYRQRRQLGYPYDAAEGSDLYLKNLNARDFGYEFLSVDRANSANIRRVNNAMMFEDIVALQGYIHCGDSCGYPGGCNNASPVEPDLFFKVDSLPATLYCKLWKHNTSGPEADADFIFIIDFK